MSKKNKKFYKKYVPIKRKKNWYNWLYKNRFIAPGTKYCGPQNWMDRGLPTNMVDEACYEHDRAGKDYSLNDMYFKWNKADEKFMERLSSQPTESWTEYADKKFIQGLYATKRKAAEWGIIGIANEYDHKDKVRVVDGKEMEVDREQKWTNIKKRKKWIAGGYGNVVSGIVSQGVSRPLKSYPYRRKKKIKISDIMHQICPYNKVLGTNNWALNFEGNALTFFEINPADNGMYVHGSKERWEGVYNAVYQTTMSSDYDNELRTYWSTSKTTTKFMNPNNFTVKLTVYLMKPVKNFNGLGETPLFYFRSLWVNGLEYPATNAPINSKPAIPAITQVQQTTGTPVNIGWQYVAFDGELRHIYLKSVPRMKSHFKLTKKKTFILNAGDIGTVTQHSKYGIVYGDNFDTIQYSPRFTEFMFCRLEVFPNNTTNGAERVLQIPASNLVVTQNTYDVVRQMQGNYPRTYYLRDDVIAGADEGGGINQIINSTTGVDLPAGRDNVQAQNN